MGLALPSQFRLWDGIVGIVSSLWAGQLRISVSIPCVRSLLRLIQPFVQCRTRTVSAGLNHLEGEGDKLTSSSDENKNSMDLRPLYRQIFCFYALRIK
jgi:hypothetical protein